MGAVVDDSVHVQVEIVEIRYLLRRDILIDQGVALLAKEMWLHQTIITS